MLNNSHLIAIYTIYTIATLQNKACNCMINSFTK